MKHEYKLFYQMFDNQASWAMWESNGNWTFVYETTGKISYYPTSGVSYESILESGWEERPLTSIVPWLHCADCNAVSYADYLCLECRND